MAALVSLIVKSRTGLLIPGQLSLLDSVRFASKKAGGSSKNLGGKSPGKRYGFKKQDGNFVHAGNILATQRLMRYHPGAHVGMGTNKTLFALEDGYSGHHQAAKRSRPLQDLHQCPSSQAGGQIQASGHGLKLST
uniref:Mitochondrial ribosomal protein L27 n=1 Tax=Oreochromis niloticus TaxID=8128 RepID=A0A669DGE8_ORENI